MATNPSDSSNSQSQKPNENRQSPEELDFPVFGDAMQAPQTAPSSNPKATPSSPNASPIWPGQSLNQANPGMPQKPQAIQNQAPTRAVPPVAYPNQPISQMQGQVNSQMRPMPPQNPAMQQQQQGRPPMPQNGMAGQAIPPRQPNGAPMQGYPGQPLPPMQGRVNPQMRPMPQQNPAMQPPQQGRPPMPQNGMAGQAIPPRQPNGAPMQGYPGQPLPPMQGRVNPQMRPMPQQNPAMQPPQQGRPPMPQNGMPGQPIPPQQGRPPMPQNGMPGQPIPPQQGRPPMPPPTSATYGRVPPPRNPNTADIVMVDEEPKPKKKKVLAIVLAIVAALLVIGAGVFVILKYYPSFAKDKDTTSTSVSEQAPTTSEDLVLITESTVPPTPTPTPGPTPIPTDGPDLTGMVIVIDAGHQATPNEEQEPLSSTMSGSKDKSSQGFVGCVTGREESEINLEVAQLLAQYLQALGADVRMTRTENDVDMSNNERAAFAVEQNPDLYIRLYCDAANDSLTSGINVCVANSGTYATSLPDWGTALANSVATATGAQNGGCYASSNYSGLNWANEIPSFMLRMGYLTNSDDDALLSDADYQFLICRGIADFCASMKTND